MHLNKLDHPVREYLESKYSLTGFHRPKLHQFSNEAWADGNGASTPPIELSIAMICTYRMVPGSYPIK